MLYENEKIEPSHSSSFRIQRLNPRIIVQQAPILAGILKVKLPIVGIDRRDRMRQIVFLAFIALLQAPLAAETPVYSLVEVMAFEK